ncbi:MAG: hypothetical protein L0H64_16435 [Pseudonocardia sp.]|nr:hypothetical protein [Pseudonocardia sp.]
MSGVRVEFFLDDEAGTWGFRVPALHIIGGGDRTRQDAEQHCMEAISFALEGDPDEYDPAAEAITLEVSVVPAA